MLSARRVGVRGAVRGLVASALVVGACGTAVAQDVAPAAVGAPKVLPAGIEDSKLVTATPLVFGTGSDALQPESQAAIASMAALLKDKTYISQVRVEGHVAGIGAAEADALGGRRALSVARALVAAGVECKRILPVTFGANKPRAVAGSPETTRVEVVVTALRDKAIGGMPLDGGGLVVGDACK
jgi:outer membrane protein OmpA-like peptidoglycan-associated protein